MRIQVTLPDADYPAGTTEDISFELAEIIRDALYEAGEAHQRGLSRIDRRSLKDIAAVFNTMTTEWEEYKRR